MARSALAATTTIHTEVGRCKIVLQEALELMVISVMSQTGDH